MEASLQDYKARVERNFAILDNLPQPIRALVHEYGSAKVVALWREGATADDIARQLGGGRV